MDDRRAGNQFARVIRFEDGTYLGQASTKVGSYLNAKLFTGSEARDKMKSYQEGEVSVHLLEDLRPGD